MFKIDPATNRINPLEVKRFTDLGFTERNHLQEWLENYPQALSPGEGDELLIIQKEFDGFETNCAARGWGRERLDLLAIDKDGNLVIIENKLDDSGRDVVWLSQFGVICQCFKVTPYHQASAELFLNVEHMTRLEQALSGPLEKIKQDLKTTDLNKEPVQDAE